MNRRAFFSTIAAGLAAAADPERLLWTPGKKLISIPRPSLLHFDNGADNGTGVLIRRYTDGRMDVFYGHFDPDWAAQFDWTVYIAA